MGESDTSSPLIPELNMELEPKNTNKLIGPVNSTPINVCGWECSALLDTGSQVTTISSEFVKAHPILRTRTIHPTNISVEGAGGQAIPHLGFIEVDIQVEKLGIQLKSVPVLVVPKTSEDQRMHCLLGTNVLRVSREQLHQKHGRNFMSKVKSSSTPWFLACRALNNDGLDLADQDGTIGVLRYVGDTPLIIPPGHQKMVSTRAPRIVGGRSFVGLVEEYSPHHPINVETCFSRVQDQTILVAVSNRTGQKVALNKNSPIAKLVMATLVEVEPLGQQEPTNQRKEILQAHPGPIPGLELPTTGLSTTERNSLEKLLQANKDVFSSGTQDFGRTKTITHEIPLVDPTPFRMPYRRIHPSDLTEVKDHLQELQEAGVIRPSKSPFASPIVIVRKKDGQIRMCVDFRKLNSRTTRDAYPIPRIEESLDALGRAKYFSQPGSHVRIPSG